MGKEMNTLTSVLSTTMLIKKKIKAASVVCWLKAYTDKLKYKDR